MSAFVKINPSGITANLVQYGTSVVTSGQNQDLTLDPGYYSINPDDNSFNASVGHRIRKILTRYSTVGLDVRIPMPTLRCQQQNGLDFDQSNQSSMLLE